MSHNLEVKLIKLSSLVIFKYISLQFFSITGDRIGEPIVEEDEVRLESVEGISFLYVHLAALRSIYFSRYLA